MVQPDNCDIPVECKVMYKVQGKSVLKPRRQVVMMTRQGHHGLAFMSHVEYRSRKYWNQEMW